MIRSTLTSRVGFVLTGKRVALDYRLWRTTAKHPNTSARHIAILTDDLRNEADKNGGLKSIDSLPGPRTFPVVGNLAHLKNRFLKIHITQVEDAKKYGQMYKDQVFMIHGVVVQDPEICEEIYRAEGKLPQRDFSLAFGEFMKERRKHNLPKSFIDLNGEEWAELRRKFHKKMLAPTNMKVYYPQFSDIAVDAVEYLRSLRDENAIVNDVRESVLGKWALEYNAESMIEAYSMSNTAITSNLGVTDVYFKTQLFNRGRGTVARQLMQYINEGEFERSPVGKFVYGYRTGLLDETLSDENRKFYEGIKVVLTNSLVLSRSKWMKYISWKKYRDFKEGMKNWYISGTKHTKQVIDLVKSADKTGKDLDQNLANSLICYLMFTKNMNIDECSIHAIELYGAGYDTTSITTSWVLYWLGMNPEKQEILYKEVLDRVPEDGSITEAAVQRMPYLRACIKESARLTPLAYNTLRLFSDDMVLRGYIIPARTPLFISNYGMGRDETLYPNANSFVPERWLRENKEENDIHPFASLPFGYGARSCIGRRIAEAEMQVFLAQLVKRLKIKYIGEEQDGECQFGLTLPNNTFAFYDR